MHRKEKHIRKDDKITFSVVRLPPGYFYALENIIIPYLVRKGQLPVEGAPFILTEKIICNFAKSMLDKIEKEKATRAGIAKEQIEEEVIFPLDENKIEKKQQQEQEIIIDG